MAYASLNGNCLLEWFFPRACHRATDGTTGIIGTPSGVCHSVGPRYVGIATMITDGKSVCGRAFGAKIIDSNWLGIHMLEDNTDLSHSSICKSKFRPEVSGQHDLRTFHQKKLVCQSFCIIICGLFAISAILCESN